MIALAQQKGSDVYVYDENGRIMFNKMGELIGFTSNTVSVKQGSTFYVYGDRGEIKFTK
jgi:hypothetical protein